MTAVFLANAAPDVAGPGQLGWERLWSEFSPLILAAGIITLAWGVWAGILLGRLRGRWQSIWPAQRFYAVSWGAFEVILLLLAAVVIVDLTLHQITWPKNWGLVRYLVAQVIQLVIYLWVPMALLRVPAYQLGWNWRRWRQDVVLGWLVWVVSIVVTFGVWAIATQLWQSIEHPLVRELQESPSWPNIIAFVVGAVILAPVAEEVVFRGLILRKMAQEPIWADLTMLIALLVAVGKGYQATSWGPLLFLVTAGPGYLTFEWMTKRLLPRPGLARAVYASSLVFAALHAEAWPAPVALFFLALFLGSVAARTQSLLGPMFLHAAFNLTAALALCLQKMAGCIP